MLHSNRKNTFSFISNAENQYIQALYEDYQANPEKIDVTWRRFFEGFEFALLNMPQALKKETAGTKNEGAQSDIQLSKEHRVFQLIEAYRKKGHQQAHIDPLHPQVKPKAELDWKNFGLDESDLNQNFVIGHMLGLKQSTLKEIIERLQHIYTRSIGIEYNHIDNVEMYQWIQQNFEATAHDINFDIDKKKRILKKLNEATVLENFLHTKFIGQKRFSLEGGENTIPAIDAIINQSAELGVKEVIIGMAHRGRINILTNIIGKTYEEIFSEFEGKNVNQKTNQGDGDVKYHLGFSSQIKTPQGKEVFLKLMPNPSHLEAVGPVVLGYSKAKAEILYNEDYKKIMPILIHGDAAVAGQGVVYELAQMSQIKSSFVGGTIHFVINNQIGFTTEPHDARTSDYCTSVAKAVDVPILHVNGDDAEAVIFAVEFAAKFRHHFQKDIFIDMVCYRKHGHNESDEPRYTQPQMYDIINKHPNPREIYTLQLVTSGKIEEKLAKSMQEEFKQLLQDRLNQVKEKTLPPFEQKVDMEWKQMRKSTPEDFDQSPVTAVAEKKLKTIMQALTQLPSHIKPIAKAQKIIEDRKKAFDENKIDWALAELLSYGSMLLDGHYIRLCGQDAIRGTFSHRHAKVFDQETGESFCQLNAMENNQAQLRVYNSLLSEYAVLGFEYGYSLGRPNNLAIWEAQFGDFSNTAQTIIDQFISSAESKWQTMSGIVMLLPHGYEGQGPEHSSARAERYLQLCAEFNMIVANCTTPANFFHIMRRQLAYEFRKPLIILSPKSLLRHPLCVSNLEEFTKGSFEEIIDDSFTQSAASKVKRVVLCTGKIYYDLVQKQQTDQRKDVAIIRLEQLHPIPFAKVDKILKQYKNAEFVWVQEEPKNMGYWNYILRKLDYYNLQVISRKSSASPASGYLSVHLKEQQAIIDQAFLIENKTEAKKKNN